MVIAGKTLSAEAIKALYQRIVDRNYRYGLGKLSDINKCLHAISTHHATCDVSASIKSGA